MYKLEVSTYSIEGVKEALKLRADRLELCSNVKEGGTTPSYGFVKAALKTGHPNVFIIVRPRGGDFLYTDDEFDIIKKDIIEAKKMGVHGVVSGILNADGTIDKPRTRQLIELATPMKFTFHRAFDMTCDYKKALSDLIDLGVDTVLTSGTKNTAIEGKEIIKELVELAQGKINILVGSGVNPTNMEELQKSTNAHEYHMSAMKMVKSEMEFFNTDLNMGNVDSDEYMKQTVDAEKIAKAVEVIKKLNKLGC
nr:copper homeostasis protein CutC [uncultured Carboxylicivirga sp.]